MSRNTLDWICRRPFQQDRRLRFWCNSCCSSPSPSLLKALLLFLLHRQGTRGMPTCFLTATANQSWGKDWGRAYPEGVQRPPATEAKRPGSAPTVTRAQGRRLIGNSPAFLARLRAEGAKGGGSLARSGPAMAWRPPLALARLLAPTAGQTRSVLLHSSLGSANFSSKGNVEPTKQPLRKPKLPVGRFDESEESNTEKEPLEKFPDDINPVTKEKGGPKGPEPTRYGDWERKGRCIDF
ncbi:succinate dehydrogenase assembly factor 4, mitochondrial [Pogona vitticeps]